MAGTRYSKNPTAGKFPTPLRVFQRSSQHLLEIWNPKSGRGVPPGCCVPERVFDDTSTWKLSLRLVIGTVATACCALGDVNDKIVTRVINPWINETNGRETGLEASVVEQANQPGEHWRSCGGTTRLLLSAPVDNLGGARLVAEIEHLHI